VLAPGGVSSMAGFVFCIRPMFKVLTDLCRCLHEKENWLQLCHRKVSYVHGCDRWTGAVIY